MTIAHLTLAHLGTHSIINGFTGVVLLVAGAGYGFGFTRTITRVLANTPTEHVPQASGALNVTIQNVTIQIGYLLGVATLGNYYLSHRATRAAFTVAGDATETAIAIAAILAHIAHQNAASESHSL